MNPKALINIFLFLALAPLLLGIVNKTKAFFAGRQGPSWVQLYYDIGKLLQKGAVYSSTTTRVFRLAPLMGLSCLFMAMMLLPMSGQNAVFSFQGDLIVFIYLLALLRFSMVCSALDTGSSFEGMGASREVQFAVLAELALFLALAALVRQTDQLSLSGIYADLSFETWKTAGPILALVFGAVLIVFLTENSRIPVDDPNTHLELTMIHEVMVLDHSGADLAFIFYSAALKFWLLGALLVGLVIPHNSTNFWMNNAFFLFGMFLLALAVGVIESVMARLRLFKVMHLLVAAVSLSILALIFQMR